MEIFADKDACCEPVLDLEAAAEHPQLQHRNYVTTNTETGEKQMGFPFKFSKDQGQFCLAPPKLGEHTFMVLQTAGYNEDDIKQLAETGVIKY